MQRTQMERRGMGVVGADRQRAQQLRFGGDCARSEAASDVLLVIQRQLAARSLHQSHSVKSELG